MKKKFVSFFQKVFLNTERGRDVFVVVFSRKEFDKKTRIKKRRVAMMEAAESV